jgi:glycosyltransferase involved in cell wall biosynthesis
MEGFGLVMVEAMGCECVVVASDIPAVHDIIIDNQTGIIVEQKNVSQIAGKIIFLLDNPGIRNSLGKMGRKYVLERYDWKITGKKYCDLFEETTC